MLVVPEDTDNLAEDQEIGTPEEVGPGESGTPDGSGPDDSQVSTPVDEDDGGVPEPESEPEVEPEPEKPEEDSVDWETRYSDLRRLRQVEKKQHEEQLTALVSEVRKSPTRERVEEDDIYRDPDYAPEERPRVGPDPYVKGLIRNQLSQINNDFLGKHSDCNTPERIELLNHELRVMGWKPELIDSDPDSIQRYPQLLERAHRYLFGAEDLKRHEISQRNKEKERAKKAARAKVSPSADSAIQAKPPEKPGELPKYDPSKETPGQWALRACGLSR